jgi:hypothetical protein
MTTSHGARLAASRPSCAGNTVEQLGVTERLCATNKTFRNREVLVGRDVVDGRHIGCRWVPMVRIAAGRPNARRRPS